MARRGKPAARRGVKRSASGNLAGPTKKTTPQSPRAACDTDNDSDMSSVQPTNPSVTARSEVVYMAGPRRSTRNMEITDSGTEEDVMDILGRDPPPDEEEWLSKRTLAALRADPASVPIVAPLLSGTTAVEQQLLREELAAAGVKLIPKAEWRQILIDNGIHSADEEVPDWDIKLSLWLDTCVPKKYLPADKRQWAKLSWLMDSPVPVVSHDKYKEAARRGDHATMLLYENARPGQKLPVAGVAKDTLVLDPPGDGGPFDALRLENRAALIDFLNTREFWNQEGWTEEVLERIPSTIMAEVLPEARAKFPWYAINKWPVHVQRTLPLDAPFWAAKDGLPFWEEARKAKKEADAERERKEQEEQDHDGRRLLQAKVKPRPKPQPWNAPLPGPRLAPIPNKIVSHKKPRKQKRPMYNPNAVREVNPGFWDSTPATKPGSDSDATVDAPDGDRLMDSPLFRESSARLGVNPDLSSPPRPVRDLLPSSTAAIPPIQPTVISISSDETQVEVGGTEEEDYQVPDGVFLGKTFTSTTRPVPRQWRPMTTKHSDSDDEEFVVQGTHPDYWLNKGFREMPVHDNIYDSLEVLYGSLSDELKQEEHFVTRPSIRIAIPDQLKSLLVDDWENVTKSLLLVPLPSQAPANFVIDTYYNDEKNNRRLGSADADLLLELCCGLKLYFEKAVGKILLYRFERLQLAEVRSSPFLAICTLTPVQVRKLWESGRYPEWEGKGPGDCYGAEHLTRMIGKTLPLPVAS
jgi:hypothetical protein